MQCRFDTTHPTFTSPVRLLAHYKAEHAHEYTEPIKVTRYCLICDAALKPSSIGQHMRGCHQIEPPFAPYLVQTSSTRMSHPTGHASMTSTTKYPSDFERDHRRVRCDVCGSEMNRHSMPKHFRVKHKGQSWRIHHTELEEAAMNTDSNELAVVDQHHDDVARHEYAHVEHEGQWSVDDIVMPVISQLASPLGVVPVETLGALFVWRDATVRMLQDVASWHRQ